MTYVPEPAPEDAQALRDLARSGAPLEEQRQALKAMLAARGLSDAGVAGAMARVRDAIVLLEDGGDHSSRLGGTPLLPAGVDWPLDPDGGPLSFIGAFDLDELPHLDPLPAGGTLLVYWDYEFHEMDYMDFHAATRVFYVEDGATAAAAAPRGAFGFDAVPLTGVPMPVLGEIERIERPDEDDDALFDAADALEHAYRHQLLGSSRDVQGPVIEEIPYWFDQGYPDTRKLFDEAEQRGEGWMLLAQVEETGELAFGDSGALYLVAPEADVRARRFDRVLGIMQCH